MIISLPLFPAGVLGCTREVQNGTKSRKSVHEEASARGQIVMTGGPNRRSRLRGDVVTNGAAFIKAGTSKEPNWLFGRQLEHVAGKSPKTKLGG